MYIACQCPKSPKAPAGRHVYSILTSSAHGGVKVKYRITVILTPQPEGGYTVTCEELPELLTEGDSVDEALENVEDAFAATLELYEDLGYSLPENIQVSDEEVPTITSPLWFQTMTPKLESGSPCNEAVPVESSPFWFQVIVSRFGQIQPTL